MSSKIELLKFLHWLFGSRDQGRRLVPSLETLAWFGILALSVRWMRSVGIGVALEPCLVIILNLFGKLPITPSIYSRKIF